MLRYTLIFTLLFCQQAFSHCPALQDVTFGCVGAHCAWTAPWWEGYQSKTAKPGEHPRSFKLAFWGPSASNPDIGSTNCFYQDQAGELIILSQNNWGGVQKPQVLPWKEGVWPSPYNVVTGKICTASQGECLFNYG